MFYLHLLIELIGSKKYWRVDKFDGRFKRGNLSNIAFLWNSYSDENSNERRKIECSQNVEN